LPRYYFIPEANKIISFDIYDFMFDLFQDHNCEGPTATSRRLAGNAAQARAATSTRNTSHGGRTTGASTQSKITNFFTGPFRTGFFYFYYE
jgi:hypothetical protein